jgi:single-strand DNA-binding protein
MNKQILLGRVGKDPEIVGTGSKITKFSLATSERWVKDGEKKERTDWHNVVAFGKSGEILAQYVKKGDLLYLEGKTRHNKYQDKDGNDRYSTDVEVSAFEFIGTKQKEEEVKPLRETADDLPF